MRTHFLVDIKSRLQELSDRSVSGTVDAVIFGGNYLDSDSENAKEQEATDEKSEYEKDYENSIRLLSEQISAVLGFLPTVIAGPKTTDGDDDAIYDNEHRRFYLRRPEIGEHSSESFNPQDLEKKENEWRMERKEHDRQGEQR